MQVHSTLDLKPHSKMEYIDQQDAEVRRQEDELDRHIETLEEALERNERARVRNDSAPLGCFNKPWDIWLRKERAALRHAIGIMTAERGRRRVEAA